LRHQAGRKKNLLRSGAAGNIRSLFLKSAFTGVPGQGNKEGDVKELTDGYSAEVDRIGREAWYGILNRFGDANLYQTWSYDAARYGEKGISHLVLKKGGTEVAAAQARIVRLPGLNKGIAYIRWGPLWRRSGNPEDPEVFRQAVRALRNEFSAKRGLVLRVYPLAFREEPNTVEQILFEEGYALHGDEGFDRTLILDLSPSLPEIRASFDQKWRNSLNRAEKNSLELVMGGEDLLFEKIRPIFDEMVKRKGLDLEGDIEHLREVQKDLPDRLKMQVAICLQNGEPCAGAIFSAMGTSGIYLVGATSDTGMKTNGSYLLQWAFITWMKEAGFQNYDLNGINPDVNPGTYKFKLGVAGKKGKDVRFLGRYQVSDDRLSAWIVRCGEAALSRYRRMRTPKAGTKTQ
jgi:hypothetical protein